MIDLTSQRGRIVSAALGLAAERPWRDVTLADIADRAATTLVALKADFGSKGEIVAAFAGYVDDEVLRRAPRRQPDQAPRDALFEVVMSRFDVLEPWKPALRSISAAAGAPDPMRLQPFLASQRWMLEAAGIGSDGLGGSVRTAGLATVYASVFRTWLDDDDAGLARTMAALDRRLRRGEQTLRRANELRAGLERVAGALCDAIGSWSRPARQAGTPPPAAGTPAPSPSPPPAPGSV